jgi:hypothetical protein
VTPVRKNLTQRPAVAAACTLVPERTLIVQIAGYGAAATRAGLGAPMTRSQWLRQESVQVQLKGINGFVAKHSPTVMDPDGGVRGKPPRRRPV